MRPTGGPCRYFWQRSKSLTVAPFAVILAALEFDFKLGVQCVLYHGGIAVDYAALKDDARRLQASTRATESHCWTSQQWNPVENRRLLAARRFPRNRSRSIFDHMTPTEFIAAAGKAFGPYAKSPENPKGAQGYHVQGEAKPYAIMFADNDEPYKFATAEEASEKARQLRTAADSRPEV